MNPSGPLYFHPTAFEPIIPKAGADELTRVSIEILRRSGALSAQIHSSIVRTRAAELVREMNSYYSNLIEGHKTLPRDIEKALEENFAKDPKKRANQKLNRAHIQTEAAMLHRMQSEPDLSIHSAEFICWLHHEFYSRLPEEMHWSEDRVGKKYKIEPGTLRSFEVEVGAHQPPHHNALPPMLDRFAQGYSSKQKNDSDQLIALASAHHRLAWIHPFGDGNGRITRLYSHAWIVRAKIDSFGLWTLSRGLARQREQYFAALRAADQNRWNDLDGRGNLSDRGLGEFCLFFLRTMLDQIEFMSGLFQFESLATRIDNYLRYDMLHLTPRNRERLSRLLKALIIEGELERGRVSEIVGLRGTAAREITRLALKEQLIDSPTEKGPLRIVFSSKILESYFPKLFQDLPVAE